mgnify:CR=1 FL=1
MKGQAIKKIVEELLANKPGHDNKEGYYIIRAHAKREWGMGLSNGRFERVTTSRDQGMGVQAFTAEGVCGFASTDNITFEDGREIMERAMALAKGNTRLEAKANRKIWEAPLLREDGKKLNELDFDHFSLTELQAMVLSLHKDLMEKSPDIAWQTSYRQVEDYWCIGRSDGTLVSYTIPRSVLMHQGTVRVENRAKSFLVHFSGVDPSLLLKEKESGALMKKAIQRGEFARKVCTAPQLPAGNYPLVIDYGLAKGLAHGAFGHAVEGDHMGESVLGEEGKLKAGMRVAPPGVHIIDGPLEGDWAYQPYSANGLVRETVEIVKDGVLLNGLGDIFSAEEAGMKVTGAGRAESYAHVPLPRMTNIRLLVDKELPLEAQTGLMEEVASLRKLLLQEDLLAKEGKHLLLLGYRGGQVNPKTGDFVFQCDGIVDLADPSLTIYQPSIFSGKILSALQAIQAGVGEGCFDAIGTCGKRGQGVPSSGGSHRYLLLDQDENVTLGGGQ